MIKLDDFLSKKKEPAQVLDLSRVKITSKEDFRKYFDKIPECKVKPEKIAPDQVRVRDKDFSFVPGKKDEKQGRDWTYPDPTPPDMKGVKLEDLCPINIDWKMLTTVRPKTKVDEDMFSRLVQLGKLDLKYQQALSREKVTNWVRRTKNPKSSIVEMRVISCGECGEDFCDGSQCSKLTYENFFRPQPVATNMSQNLSLLAGDDGDKKGKKRKKKKRRRRKRKTKEKREGVRKLGKTSIFNRPISRGCTRDHFKKRSTDPVEKRPRRALSSTRSISNERRQIHCLPIRSKSAPRIHFDRDILSPEYKQHDYVSDSAPSNTDYSTQSDSESPDYHQKCFGSRLRLSGRRKLLSARVSFADRNRRRESADSGRSRFLRQCSLYKYCDCDGTLHKSYKGSKFSGSSSPSLSRSPEKTGPSSSSPPPPTKPPSTIQIQFDDSLSSSSALQFPEKIFLPSPSSSVPTRKWPGGRRRRRRDLYETRHRDLTTLADNLSKIELKLDDESPVRRERGPTRIKTSNSQSRRMSDKSKTISPESCIQGRGLLRNF